MYTQSYIHIAYIYTDTPVHASLFVYVFIYLCALERVQICTTRLQPRACACRSGGGAEGPYAAPKGGNAHISVSRLCRIADVESPQGHINLRKDSTDEECWNPPLIGHQNQDVGSLCSCDLLGHHQGQKPIKAKTSQLPVAWCRPKLPNVQLRVWRSVLGCQGPASLRGIEWINRPYSNSPLIRKE